MPDDEVQLELDLVIGQTLRIGPLLVTVTDIDGGEVQVRVESVDASENPDTIRDNAQPKPR